MTLSDKIEADLMAIPQSRRVLIGARIMARRMGCTFTLDTRKSMDWLAALRAKDQANG